MEATVPFRDVIIYIPPGRPYFCVEPVSHIPGEIGSTRLEAGATLAGDAVFRLSNL
jgi:aldose 1-epimerase